MIENNIVKVWIFDFAGHHRRTCLNLQKMLESAKNKFRLIDYSFNGRYSTERILIT